MVAPAACQRETDVKEVVEGSAKPTFPVILEFPGLEAAQRWYDSEEYRPLKALRLAAAQANGFLVQGV